jgi:hypothetical protein
MGLYRPNLPVIASESLGRRVRWTDHRNPRDGAGLGGGGDRFSHKKCIVSSGMVSEALCVPSTQYIVGKAVADGLWFRWCVGGFIQGRGKGVFEHWSGNHGPIENRFNVYP